MATVSFVIPVSRFDEIRDCLDSLRKSRMNPKDLLEVIIVCDPGKKLIYEKPFSELKIIESDRPNPSYKRNLGVRHSVGEYLVFIDDDTIVSPEFAQNYLERLKDHPHSVLSGPNYDDRPEFRYFIANQLQSVKFAEGLFSHRKMSVESIETQHKAHILANLGTSRKVFNQVGGFNEIADFYMDDTEFCFIANKLGCRFYFFKNLTIQHNVRPIFLPFFKRQSRARFHAGMNTIVHPECYMGAFQVKIFFGSLAFLIILLTIEPWSILGLALGYLMFLFYVLLRYLKYDTKTAFVMPVCIFFTHFNAYVSYGLGILYGFLARFTIHRRTIAHKKIRYRTCVES